MSITLEFERGQRHRRWSQGLGGLGDRVRGGDRCRVVSEVDDGAVVEVVAGPVDGGVDVDQSVRALGVVLGPRWWRGSR